MHTLDLKKSQIRDRVDLIEVISEHVTLRQRGRRWVGLCPFHNEKTPSFTVNPDLGIFKCFGCGKGGDVFSFVQAQENISFMEALRLLADRAGVELSAERGAGGGPTDGPTRAEVAKVNEWAASYFSRNLADESLGASTRQYLADRQIPGESVERFRLGFAAANGPSLMEAALKAGFSHSVVLAADLVRTSDRGSTYETFRNRLMFPIKDSTQRFIGFGGRALGDDPAKYLNTRQNILFDKGRSLYGIDVARKAMTDRGRAIIVEGYTDCLAAHQAGFPETVATMGTALTEAQVDLLRRYCEELILLFDSDEAGLKASDRAIRVALPRQVTVRIARISDGSDPCEFLIKSGPEAFLDVLNRSVDALEFKWSLTRQKLGASASGRLHREAILDFVGVIAEAFDTGAVDEIQRGQIALRVADVLKIESRQVHQLFARLQKKSAGASRRSSTSPATPVPGSGPNQGEQGAWTTLLQVALQEPGMLASEDDLPSTAAIADDRDRRIAEIVFDLAKRVGEFRVADVLSRCVEAVDSERVAELAAQWGDRGNFEETFRLALERIRVEIERHEVAETRNRLLSLPSEEEGSASARDELARLQQGLKARRHFVPNRLLSGLADARWEDSSPAGDPVTTVME